MNSKLIHNINVFEDAITSDSWALLKDGGAELGRGDSWKSLVEGAELIDGHGKTLVAGLIDTHCHGAAGFSANDGLEGMLKTLEFNAANGVARSLLSLVTSTQQELIQLCNSARELKDDPRFLGLHLEGPYLAHSKKGAHDENKLTTPNETDLGELIATGVVKSMTIAPELFTEPQLEQLENGGVRLCLGHTEIDYRGAKQFFENHPKSVMTHAFNAMNPIQHREPGPIPAAIESGVFIELIVDGVHVHESVVKLIPAEQLILVTDAMSATGMPDGSYQLGSLEVEVRDSIARTSSGNLAGSTLTLAGAVKNYTAISGSKELALRAATVNPAKAYGIEWPTLSLENHLLLDL